jgi:hypothetical protein
MMSIASRRDPRRGLGHASRSRARALVVLGEIDEPEAAR